MSDADDLVALLTADTGFRQILAAVADLGLPDWAVGAGAVRNRVWDRLHGYDAPSDGGADIDVLFFDTADTSKATEREIETRLAAVLPEHPWSVRNQARMHRGNGDPPYAGTFDAMSHWLETATTVAVTSCGGAARVMAPFGLDDLFGLAARPTPSGIRRPAAYRRRVAPWPRRWPKLTVHWPA